MQVRVLPSHKPKKLKMETNIIYNEDCLETMARMPDNSVNIILTSPPYNKSRTSISERALQNLEIHYKDFNDAKTNEEYIAWTMARFKEFGRILADNGVVAYNLSYATESAEKGELMWLVVSEILKEGTFALGDVIVWKKKNAVPNNTSPNKMTRICEFIFIFCKRQNYENYHSNKKLLYKTKTGQSIFEPFTNLITAENNDGACEIHKATYSTNMCVQVLDRYGVRGGAGL